MNKFDSYNCVSAKEKAIAIIESCTTFMHYENAAKFLELFLQQFNNRKDYEELVMLLRIKWFKLI